MSPTHLGDGRALLIWLFLELSGLTLVNLGYREDSQHPPYQTQSLPMPAKKLCVIVHGGFCPLYL